MSIFDSIKNAIFGHAAAARPTPAAKPAPSATQNAAPAGSAAPRPTAAAPSAAPAPTASAPIDIEPVLDDLAKTNGQKLNWRTSIVDLMKLVNLDSSLEHRKQLAKELGYTGSTDDSAAMNIWLHKAVMGKLAANGGKVPANLH